MQNTFAFILTINLLIKLIVMYLKQIIKTNKKGLMVSICFTIKIFYKNLTDPKIKNILYPFNQS